MVQRRESDHAVFISMRFICKLAVLGLIWPQAGVTASLCI